MTARGPAVCGRWRSACNLGSQGVSIAATYRPVGRWGRTLGTMRDAGRLCNVTVIVWSGWQGGADGRLPVLPLLPGRLAPTGAPRAALWAGSATLPRPHQLPEPRL